MNRPSLRALAVVLCSLLIVTGCDDKSGDGDSSADPATPSAEETKGDESDPAEESSFILDHDKKWKPCDVMTADVVAEVSGIAADELDQASFGSLCNYTWESEDGKTEFIANMTSFRVFETVDKAKFRYQGSARDQSSAEVAKAHDEIRKKAGEKLDNEKNADTKKKVADDIIDALSDQARTNVEVKGVGDEAAMNEQDGTLYVRRGNVFFGLTTWHGEPLKERTAPTTEKVQEERAKHLAKNFDEQKKQSKKLAKAILARLDETN